ncbi:MAG: hypothetical protein DHS20C13_06310 [Thermodesulfobacteriota bacterium]|nr:MAG: hypothetical protein DHS20C13_06310 [Thermodesulfobacteriota bacterium]
MTMMIISFPSVKVKPTPAINDAPMINPTTAKTNLKILYPNRHIKRPKKIDEIDMILSVIGVMSNVSSLYKHFNFLLY